MPGNIGLDLEYYVSKLTSISSSNTLVFTTGTLLTGGASGVIVRDSKYCCGMYLVHLDITYVKYNKTGTNNTTVFVDGETITGTNSDSVVYLINGNTTVTGS